MLCFVITKHDVIYSSLTLHTMVDASRLIFSVSVDVLIKCDPTDKFTLVFNQDCYLNIISNNIIVEIIISSSSIIIITIVWYNFSRKQEHVHVCMNTCYFP